MSWAWALFVSGVNSLLGKDLGAQSMTHLFSRQALLRTRVKDNAALTITVSWLANTVKNLAFQSPTENDLHRTAPTYINLP